MLRKVCIVKAKASMQVQINQLSHSLLNSGYLTDCLDAIGTGQSYPSSTHLSFQVTVPPSVLKRLLDAKRSKRGIQEGLLKVNVSSINHVHLGVLVLLGKLYKPVSEAQQSVIKYLVDNGIDETKLLDAGRYARLLGFNRQLHSRPEIGRRHARKYKI